MAPEESEYPLKWSWSRLHFSSWKLRLKSCAATMSALRWLSKRRRSSVGYLHQRPLPSSVEGSWRGGGGVGPEALGEEWFELEIGAAGPAMDQNERERVDADALWQAPEISDALSSTEFCLPRLDEEFTWHAVPVVESNAVTMQEHYKATLQRLATTGTVLVKEEDDDNNNEHKEGSPVPEEQNAGPLVKLG